MPDQLIELIRGFEVQPVAFLDVALTALLIYGLLSLIRGTRAVRLVIGVSILYAIYVAAQILGLKLLSQILQAAAVVGLLALVVVFQPELRRGLERIGRVGSLGWVLAPATRREYDRVSRVIAQVAATLSSQKIGGLIVIERETGLTDTAESGIPIDARLSPELLETIFTPRSALHDGAVIIRHDRVVSAGVVLPLSESGSLRERFGTRHRAALGISEQTDAIVVVVSEETGQIGLVERGRIVRNMDEERLRRALFDILEHNTAMAAARIPARANALRRNLPIGRPRRHNGPTEAAGGRTTPAVAPTARSGASSPAPTGAAPGSGGGASATATTPGASPSGRFE